MVKQLTQLLGSDADFLDRKRTTAFRAVRHLMFAPDSETDYITIPLCGDLDDDLVAMRNTVDINCTECLQRAIELSAMDSYADALAHVTSYAPTVLQPDPDILRRTFRGEPTAEAHQHKLAALYLRKKALERAADLPKNIIGTRVETYFFNMIDLLLIDPVTGEPNSIEVAALQARLNDLLP